MKKRLSILVCMALLATLVTVLYAQTETNDTNPATPDVYTPTNTAAIPMPDTIYAQTTGSSKLYTIDVITGTATLIGTTSGPSLTDIAFWGPSLYGISFYTLYRINPISGERTTIGSLGASGVNALAVSPITGKMYAASTSGTFMVVNPATGHSTQIGTYGTGKTSSGDLAFDNNGTLYATVNLSAASTDALAIINLETGAATIIGDTGYTRVYGLVHQNGALFAVTSSGDVLSINKNTGAATLIGPSGVSAFGGLALSPQVIYQSYLPFLIR